MDLQRTVIFVTSFQPDMYHATGTHLLNSFLDCCYDLQILACVEKFAGESLKETDMRLHVHDITDDPVLKRWLAENATIIPKHLGGLAEPCNCKITGFGIEENHLSGCNNFWYNRNAARWFRKVIALNVAARRYPDDILVWVDSDCRFKRKLNSDVIASWFSGSSVFYLKGPQRAVLDSGILGLDLPKGGAALLNVVLDRYLTGLFRKDRRWDDGFQFQLALNEKPDIRAIDLAVGKSQWRGEVVATSLVGKYLDHFKGVHGPVLRLMT